MLDVSNVAPASGAAPPAEGAPPGQEAASSGVFDVAFQNAISAQEVGAETVAPASEEGSAGEVTGEESGATPEQPGAEPEEDAVASSQAEAAVLVAALVTADVLPAADAVLELAAGQGPAAGVQIVPGSEPGLDVRVETPGAEDVLGAQTQAAGEAAPLVDASRAGIGIEVLGAAGQEVQGQPVAEGAELESKLAQLDGGAVAPQEAGETKAETLEAPDRGGAAEEALEAPVAATKEETERGALPEGARANENPQLRPGRTETGEPQTAQAEVPAVEVKAAAEGPAAGAPRSPEVGPQREAVMDQVVRSARLNLARGNTRFELRLEPPSLGRMGVVLDLKDGVLSVSFSVENEAVRELLQNSMPQLRAALTAQGVSVEGLDVHSSGPEAGEQQGPDTGSGGERGDGGGAEAEASASAAATRAGALRAEGGSVEYWA